MNGKAKLEWKRNGKKNSSNGYERKGSLLVFCVAIFSGQLNRGICSFIAIIELRKSVQILWRLNSSKERCRTRETKKNELLNEKIDRFYTWKIFSRFNLDKVEKTCFTMIFFLFFKIYPDNIQNKIKIIQLNLIEISKYLKGTCRD